MANEFPDGWKITSGNPALSASIVVPAVAGIARVLDDWTVLVFTGVPAAAESADVLLSSSDGLYTNFILGFIQWPGGALATFTDSDSDVDIACGAGASLTVSCNPGTASVEAFIRIRGHDL